MRGGTTVKQIKRIQIITYRWWKPDKTDIKPEHIGALEETADDHIAKMMAKGFTSGDLHDNIHMTDDDPEGGIDYSGWWDISTYVLDK